MENAEALEIFDKLGVSNGLELLFLALSRPGKIERPRAQSAERRAQPKGGAEKRSLRDSLWHSAQGF